MRILLQIIGALALVALSVGCGSSEPTRGRSSLGQRLKSSQPGGFDVRPDLDVARIYGEPMPTGRLPQAPAFSPDGTKVAYLRRVGSGEHSAKNELWLFDTALRRDHPVPIGTDVDPSSFVWLSDKKLVFIDGGDLYLTDLGGTKRRLTTTNVAESGVQSAPGGRRIAFLRGRSLVIYDVKKDQEIHISPPRGSVESYGSVSWLYGEEFSMERGFGWSKDGSKLWFMAVDESSVVHRTVIADEFGRARSQAYPRPGEPNPKVRVGVAHLGRKMKQVWLDTAGQDDDYLPRALFAPDGKSVYVMRFDRLQTQLDLLRCSAVKGDCVRIVDERDPRWVNFMGEPLVYDGGLLWLSERDGFAHIYRTTLDGTGMRQLTSGGYVVSSIDHVDADRKVVYFTANRAAHYDWGVYKVSLDGSKPERVLEIDGHHVVRFAANGRHFMDTHSALDRLPRVEVFTSAGTSVGIAAESQQGNYGGSRTTTDIFPIDAGEGRELWAMLTRPISLESNRRYPVLVYVYGGPDYQSAVDCFSAQVHPWRELLASRGVLVFSVDGRGSFGHGKDVSSDLHLRLGDVVLEDQLQAIEYLRDQPFVDPDRLAIYGWSFGGYMVVRALLEQPGLFRAGVAVAPVSDWRYYDSAYTERYMQRPSDNPEGYAATSLLNKVEALQTPLLLVHGLADDNVHPVNSTLLVDALIESEKQFEMMVYPGKDHSIEGSKARTDLYTRITRFIERHLGYDWR